MKSTFKTMPCQNSSTRSKQLPIRTRKEQLQWLKDELYLCIRLFKDQFELSSSSCSYKTESLEIGTLKHSSQCSTLAVRLWTLNQQVIILTDELAQEKPQCQITLEPVADDLIMEQGASNEEVKAKKRPIGKEQRNKNEDYKPYLSEKYKSKRSRQAVGSKQSRFLRGMRK